ncbi:hypothetical protein KDM41_15540 [bacterium]|nr:hypothetical protein [bacterium]
MKTGSITGTALVLALLIVAAAPAARAQDSHYWDSQFGTRSELLGGLVVGAPTDLSATYYNPAWIALNRDASLLLTTRAIESYTIELENALGTEADLSTSTVGASPGYLAGRFTIGDGLGWTWAYTYLERVRFRYDAGGALLGSDPLAAADETRWESVESYLLSEASENWYGVSFSKALRSNLAIGFSPYLAQRSQRSRVQVAAGLLGGDGSTADLNIVNDYRYWHFRLLLKAGVALRSERWSAGLTITTPSLGLVSSAEVYERTYSADGIDPDNPLAEPYLSADAQDGLDAVWKSPLSVALGGAVRIGHSRIHVTAEWFDAVGRFDVIDPEPYEIQSTPGEFQDYDYGYAAEAVLNYGAGVERFFSTHFSLFASYRLDRTTTPSDLDNRLNATSWDLHHVTGGASFELAGMEFTTGLQYSWGDADAREALVIDPDVGAGSIGDEEPGTLKFTRMKALLGFNLPFGTMSE